MFLSFVLFLLDNWITLFWSSKSDEYVIHHIFIEIKIPFWFNEDIEILDHTENDYVNYSQSG